MYMELCIMSLFPRESPEASTRKRSTYKVALMVREFIGQNSIAIMEHPSYSPRVTFYFS